jgi:hypothetical protein
MNKRKCHLDSLSKNVFVISLVVLFNANIVSTQVGRYREMIEQIEDIMNNK